jgi:hypothetical protein
MEKKLPPLIQALLDPACYKHATQNIHVVETHISWVLLTGPYAYKIKKPVDLGFLDFSTLEQRHFYCEEELRLNRRLAETLYLGVIPITGSPAAPTLSGSGAAIEYAVKMTQFSETARLDRMLARGELRSAHIDLLIHELAQFHGHITIAGDDAPFGNPDQVMAPVRQNFEQIRPRIEAADQALLQHLQTWSERSFADLKEILAQRKRQGFIRECHGDAHLANMVWHEGRVLLFDCLEFSEALRWIDTLSELAFLVMDLEAACGTALPRDGAAAENHGRTDFAYRALNAYLEQTGDYAGLTVLRFYLVYRALVRAKVACIRANQSGLSDPENQQVRNTYLGYVNLAAQYTQTPHTALIITHGLSGCGKTWLSQQLLEQLGAIRLRSDVERKRLYGLAPQARSDSNIDQGIYTADASQRTYAHLAKLAGIILRAGYPVIVDATFLARHQREQLHAVAEHAGVPFIILDIQVPDAILRARLQQRALHEHDASEANEAVLDRQRASREPLSVAEQKHALAVNGESAPDMARLVADLRARFQTK